MALADTGKVAVDAEGVVTFTGDLTDAVAEADELVRARRAGERVRTETMEAYAHEVGCRWRFLLQYFGEPALERCGHCDNDQRANAAPDQPDTSTAICSREPRPAPRLRRRRGDRLRR